MAGQAPFAIILGCSDSRVPAEFVFNQGLGDLFVIRVAGNIVSPSQIGSVEFAAEQFGTSLVIVLGHTQCGAIQATLDSLMGPRDAGSPHLESIVDRIRPAVEPLLPGEGKISDTLMERAVRANIAASVVQLRTGSVILRERVAKKRLVVTGAEYSLETGEVRFLDEVSDALKINPS